MISRSDQIMPQMNRIRVCDYFRGASCGVRLSPRWGVLVASVGDSCHYSAMRLRRGQPIILQPACCSNLLTSRVSVLPIASVDETSVADENSRDCSYYTSDEARCVECHGRLPAQNVERNLQTQVSARDRLTSLTPGPKRRLSDVCFQAAIDPGCVETQCLT